MTWFYLLVVIFAIGYMVLVTRKYTDYAQVTKPYIADQIEKNSNLQDSIDEEKEAIRGIVEQIKDEEILTSDLKLGIAKAEEDIGKEKAIQEKLELASQMKQFNKQKS